MDHNPNDETIKEILEEDHIEIKNGGKKKSCLMRAIIFIIMLTVIFLGFIYVQQYLLDIEAEAIVRAAQTTTALVNDPSTRKDLISDTPDPAIVRTATIAAQLTSVAEFQKTVTSAP